MKISNRIGILVQARMRSSRLPGKSMKPIGGKPMLAYLIESLLEISEANQIVLVTSEDESNQPIVELGSDYGITVYQGSEEDVASRYFDVLSKRNFEYFHRICGDSPYYSSEVLLEPSLKILDSALQFISSMPNKGFPMGNNVELFETNFFLNCFGEPGLIDNEHVTAGIYKQADRFQHVLITCDIDGYAYSKLKFSVDTQEDFDVAKSVLESLSFQPWNFSFEEKYELIEKINK